MVGVPRSRGCAACREQKKRCIVNSTPPCSRCERLDISCVGYGERRLKFQDESQNFISHRTKNIATARSIPSSNSLRSSEALQYEHGLESTASVASTSSSNSSQSTKSFQDARDAAGRTMITTPPTNVLSSLIVSFTRSIDGRDIDTGHHLAWNFGDFLLDVPRYLGFNAALDPAADALVAGYDHFRRYNGRYTTASARCLGKYSQAVKGLRRCLSTVENACDPATLCAIQIIMTVEALIGISSASPLQHAGGAARILKCRGTRPPKDELEKRILLTLRGPVVIQAFFLEESFYTADDWTNITSGFSKDVDDEESFFSGLAATARLFQSTRRALSQDTTSKEEKDQLIFRASTLRQTVTERLSDLSKRLDKARDSCTEDMHTIKNKFDHGSCTRDYGLALSTQIQVNCILSALRGELSDSIKRANAGLCQEICKLGESDATYHRPLGSGWIFIALSVAYTGASSIQDKTRVMKVLANYSYDFPKEKAEVQMAEMEQFAKYLRCDDLAQESGR